MTRINTPDRGPRTVLLVDDDGDFLFQQKLQLEAAGFHVLTAAGQRRPRKSSPSIAPIWRSST